MATGQPWSQPLWVELFQDSEMMPNKLAHIKVYNSWKGLMWHEHLRIVVTMSTFIAVLLVLAAYARHKRLPGDDGSGWPDVFSASLV